MARFVAGLLHNQIDQACFKRQPNLPRRLFDGQAQFLPIHRPKIHLGPLHTVGQWPIGSNGATEKVSSQGKHQHSASRGRSIQHIVDEAPACCIVLTEREQLFPLIHDEEQPVRPGLLRKQTICDIA